MSQTTIARPPFDPAYQHGSGVPGLSDDLDLASIRQASVSFGITEEALSAKYTQFTRTDLNVPAIKDLSGNDPITLSLFHKKDSQNTNRAAIVFIHGGGQIVGTRFHGVDLLLESFSDSDDLVTATVEYRLAPEHPAPAGTHDCYAATTYLYENAAELGIDSSRIAVFGSSGGAALAAATCLLARQRKYPPISTQILNIPMLDDSGESASAKQFETGTIWPNKVNQGAWDLVLGSDRNVKDVDEIRCPGRATDLSNLPPAFIDVGQCEVFRDAAVAYASKIWQAGGTAELHVWPGVYHGAQMFEPDVPVSVAMRRAMKGYVERALRLGSGAQDTRPQL